MRYTTPIVFAVALGCGGGDGAPAGVTLRGRIVNEGEPLAIEAAGNGLDKKVIVEFVPLEEGNAGVEVGEVDAEGAFIVRGPGYGIAPSRYRLVVKHLLQGFGSDDALEGRFGPENSPIEIDISNVEVGTTHEVGEIDLADPETFPK